MAEAFQNTLFKKALESIDHKISERDVWLLSNPNVLWSTYEKNKECKGPGLYGEFFEHAVDCIEKRVEAYNPLPFGAEKKGRWLLFYPYNALFEDVAREESNGFFGSGDCPPPAFWTHIREGVLASFIPQKYEKTADLGVEICVNGTLKWQA